MALDFLGNIGTGLQQFTPAAQGIGSLLQAFGVGQPKINYGPSPAEAQAYSLIRALSDPNNSLVKQNTDINLQKGMQDFLMQLRQRQLLDARRQGRGLRPTFFSPERADETIDYLTTRGLPAITAQARERATSDIRQNANDLLSIGTRQQTRMNQRRQDDLNFAAGRELSGGLGGMIGQTGRGLQDLIRALQGM